MASNEPKPLTALVLPVILKFSETPERRRMTKSIPALRPIHERLCKLIQKVEFSCPRGREIRESDRILCEMDGRKFIQLEGQSDEDYFRIIQEKVLRKEHRIKFLSVNPSTYGWYHRLPVFSELPVVKKFELWGTQTSPLLFKGLIVREAHSTTANPEVLGLTPFKNARILIVDFILGHLCIPALQECRATHWTVRAVTNGYKDDWVFEKFASGVMEVGSFYKGNRQCSCEPLLQRMLQKYPQMVRDEQEKYILDLGNETKLVAWVDQKEVENPWKKIITTEVELHLEIVKIMPTTDQTPKEIKFTAFVLPVIVQFSDMRTRRRMAKSIPEIRKIHEQLIREEIADDLRF